MRATHAIAASAGSRRQNFLALNYFHHHLMRLPQPAENKKPMVGFSARFFLEARIRRKVLPDNNLQTQKTTKT
jgi:hypothetical protein